ncbi:MAG: hypothetical protein ACK5YR_08010 [Pirellula sp.]|jgi:hypothetical protein
MSAESTAQNLNAAYELLKQWTDIGNAVVLDEYDPAAIYESSVAL